MSQNLIAIAINKLMPLINQCIEYGIGITPGGKLLKTVSSGHNDRIIIEREYLNALTNGGIFVHYHPKGYSLSFKDFETAHYYNLAGIIAFVTNGYNGKGIYVINNPRSVDYSRIKNLFIRLHFHEVNILNIKCQKNAKLNYSKEYKKIDRKVWLKISKITKLNYYWIRF